MFMLQWPHTNVTDVTRVTTRNRKRKLTAPNVRAKTRNASTIAKNVEGHT